MHAAFPRFRQVLQTVITRYRTTLANVCTEYVYIKPVLAVATVILKLVGKYGEGDLRGDAGYLYVSLVYNISIFVALYCLAMFWMVVNDDLQPFRPMPKFLCVKVRSAAARLASADVAQGILFFSFWQALAISILVAAGAIRQLGPYTDSEHISLALTDTLICFEMPFFAVAHMYAFSARDYVAKRTQYAARMRIWFALRDACGVRDLVEDFRATLRGEGFAYRMFEPAEGGIHQGTGRERRIRAGLRYADGGKKKYWLPMPDERAHADVRNIISGRGSTDQYAPLGVPEEQDGVVHAAPDLEEDEDEAGQVEDPLLPGTDPDALEADGLELAFEPPGKEEDMIYDYSRGMMFGDYGYPVIDVSGERARAEMWAEEERILRDERAAAFSPAYGTPGAPRAGGYGAVDVSARARSGKEPERANVFGSFPALEEGRARPRRSDDYFARAGAAGTSAPLSPTQIDGPPVIDFEHDRIPDMGGSGGGVRLSWARTSTPRSERPSPRHAHTGEDAAGTPVEVVDEGYDSPVAGSPALANSKAVDLVVEDHEAEQERRTRVRRKGEPVLKKNLGRVYRREYNPVDQTQHDSKHEEDDEQAHGGLIETVEDAVDAVVGEVVERDDVISPAHEDRRSVSGPSRQTTPFFAPNESNPWA